MSFRDCIRNAVAQKEITLDEAQQIEKRYDALVAKVFSRGKAREQLIAELEAEAFEKKRRALLTETKRQQLDQELFGHRDHKGRQNPAEAFVMMHEHFGEARFADIESSRLAMLGQAHAKMEALLSEFRKGWFSGDLRRSRSAVAAKMENVVRELFGEDSGDAAAKGLAGAFSDISEDLRQRLNGAGGAIRKLEKWGLPQFHNREAVLTAGRKVWTDRIVKDAYAYDNITGEKLEGDALRQALDEGGTWLKITTDGWSAREPTGQRFGKGALFSQRTDHRFLHFKDAKTWLAYARDFGEGDPFAAMMGHVGSMVRDIAAMERLGPNPEAMREYLKQRLMQQAAAVAPARRTIAEQTAELKELNARLTRPSPRYEELADRIGQVHLELDAIRKTYRPQLGGKPSRRDRKRLKALDEELGRLLVEIAPWRNGEKPIVETDQAVAGQIDRLLDEMHEPVPWPDDVNPMDRANGAIAKADDLWAVQRGSLNAPVNSRIAHVLDAARAFVTAASLGSAALSAVSDVAFQKVTRRMAGLASSDFAILKGYLQHFAPENRREAVRAGLILDSAVHVMHQQARYAGSFASRNWAQFLADRTIGLSGLSAWTQAGKHAFGMALQAEFADRVHAPFLELPELLRSTLARHGFTAAEWDRIRMARLYEPEAGATFLRPVEIERAVGRELAEKYLAMILRETRYAVPEPTVRASAFMKGGSRPGSLVGELARSISHFKSFGVAVVMLHGGRIAREIGAGNGARGAKYAGALLITGALYGALALQLKELVQGRDPRSMDSAGFWGAAVLQGGGLGIYGDFLFSGVNRFGGGLTSTVAGPLAGRADRLRDLIVGNAEQAAAGEKTNFGRELVGVLRQNTPGGSLWYMRAAYERIVLDQLQERLDPGAHRAFRRKMRQQEKAYGNRYWWQPGETRPRRGPDLKSAAGR